MNYVFLASASGVLALGIPQLAPGASETWPRWALFLYAAILGFGGVAILIRDFIEWLRR